MFAHIWLYFLLITKKHHNFAPKKDSKNRCTTQDNIYVDARMIKEFKKEKN